MGIIDLEKCTITVLENGIVKLKTKENISLKMSDMLEIDRFYQEKLKIKSGLFLIIFSNGLKGDNQSKEKFVNADEKGIKRAEAIVIQDIAHRVEADFYLKNKTAKHPIRVFDNEKDAITWLLLH